MYHGLITMINYLRRGSMEVDVVKLSERCLKYMVVLQCLSGLY
jgi:hypothetical protein